jgi:hypothetical protein
MAGCIDRIRAAGRRRRGGGGHAAAAASHQPAASRQALASCLEAPCTGPAVWPWSQQTNFPPRDTLLAHFRMSEVDGTADLAVQFVDPGDAAATADECTTAADELPSPPAGGDDSGSSDEDNDDNGDAGGLNDSESSTITYGKATLYTKHLNQWFRNIAERMRIFQRWREGWAGGAEGEGRPQWTQDKIFQTGRFCNVFRFHDRTSVWLLARVIGPLHRAGR